jgi:epoxyqueuosine reductase
MSSQNTGQNTVQNTGAQTRLSAATLTAALKAEAAARGFDLCRVVPVAPAPHADFFDRWLALDRPGAMRYLTRFADKRRDPARLADRSQDPFQSLVVLAVNYHQFDLPAAVRDDPSRGILASYAWGDDYHELIRPALYDLDAWLAAQTGRTTRGKGLVDTGPVLERDWAHRAGIGFTGKNCCTIHPLEGSWLLLATLLVPEVLDYDPVLDIPSQPSPDAVAAGLPFDQNYGSWTIPLTGAGDTATGTCGRCTRCGDACPTGAFVGPYHLDPQRCISYWTIETQAPIPMELRPAFRNRIFGCDICQEVCPWNGRLMDRTPRLAGLTAIQDRAAPPLLAGFANASPYWLDDAAFADHFRRSPVLRATRPGMARTVAVALGNWAHADAADALLRLLADPSPVVRGHAAWGLGRLIAAGRSPHALAAALRQAQSAEPEEWVRGEIAQARQTQA